MLFIWSTEPREWTNIIWCTPPWLSCLHQEGLLFSCCIVLCPKWSKWGWWHALRAHTSHLLLATWPSLVRLHFCQHAPTSQGHAWPWHCAHLGIFFHQTLQHHLPLCSHALVLSYWRGTRWGHWHVDGRARYGWWWLAHSWILSTLTPFIVLHISCLALVLIIFPKVSQQTTLLICLWHSTWTNSLTIMPSKLHHNYFP